MHSWSLRFRSISRINQSFGRSFPINLCVEGGKVLNYPVYLFIFSHKSRVRGTVTISVEVDDNNTDAGSAPPTPSAGKNLYPYFNSSWALVCNWQEIYRRDCLPREKSAPEYLLQTLLGLASSPYVTSTVIQSVRQSVSQTRFSYFPPLDFSDFLHQASLL